MKRMPDNAREILLYLIVPAVALLGLGFSCGYLAGQRTAPIVQYVVPEREEPIRSYIISQRKAGMHEWEHIRIEEYIEDIEFVERKWRVTE